MIDVVFIVNIPSYHQVNVLDAMALRNDITFKVIYLKKLTSDRNWMKELELKHPHEFVDHLDLGKQLYINKNIFTVIKRLNPKITVITQYANITMQFLMYYFIIFRKKWVFWAENPGVAYTENPIMKNDLARRFFRYLALMPLKFNVLEVWGIGERACDVYGNLTTAEVKNVPYFFDTTKFQVSKGLFLEKKVKILYSGKLNYRKGFDILMDAIQLLNLNRNDFVVYIVGNGEMKDKYQNISNVEFIGFFERDELGQLYSNYDLFVFPTRYDGWGMVLPEAMASGLLCISSHNAGSALDMIRDKENGFLLNENNSREIFDKINFVLDNKNIMDEMVKDSLETVKKYDSTEGSKEIVNYILTHIKNK